MSGPYAFQTLYLKRNSVVEKIHPVAKIVFTLLTTINLICLHQIYWMLVMVAGLIILWLLARLPIQTLFLTIFTLSLLFVSNIIYHSWIQHESAIQALVICIQIAGIVISFSLLVRTTSPIQLADGLEIMLRPLQRIGVSSSDISMILMIALRFIPILSHEFEKIYKAQIARGGGFHKGNILKRSRALLPILIPMFIQTVQRAEELAVAMDARGYQSFYKRTAWNPFTKTQLQLHLSVAIIIPLSFMFSYVAWFCYIVPNT